MSVLVYTESDNGSFKKTAYEVASYAKGIADMLGTDVAAISFHANDAGELGNYGVSKLQLFFTSHHDTPHVGNSQIAFFNKTFLAPYYQWH